MRHHLFLASMLAGIAASAEGATITSGALVLNAGYSDGPSYSEFQLNLAGPGLGLSARSFYYSLVWDLAAPSCEFGFASCSFDFSGQLQANRGTVSGLTLGGVPLVQDNFHFVTAVLYFAGTSQTPQKVCRSCGPGRPTYDVTWAPSAFTVTGVIRYYFDGPTGVQLLFSEDLTGYGLASSAGYFIAQAQAEGVTTYTFTPEPGTGWMLAACVGMGLLARRVCHTAQCQRTTVGVSGMARNSHG